MLHKAENSENLDWNSTFSATSLKYNVPIEIGCQKV